MLWRHSLCFPVASILRVFSSAIRDLALLSFFQNKPPSGLGFLFGCMFCFGSKIGWYHAIFLPIILIEMETGVPSFWGAVDECSLVLVCAGICLANILVPVQTTIKSMDQTSLSIRGLRTNLLYGDFIEVAYPYMERFPLVNLAGYLASGISVEILCNGNTEEVKSSAYLPLPLSVWLAEDIERMLTASAVAFSVPLALTLINNALFQNWLARKGE